MSGLAVGLAGVIKRFDATTAVDHVTMRFEPGSFTALLGPSGSGKSTLLALLAGLLDPDGGDVTFDGRSMRGVRPEHRQLAMMFQKPLLFPHLTVGENVGFGLRMRRVPRSAIRQRVRDMLERVELAQLADRRVTDLSGGQEQRVALARALIVEPRLLLLDEPFSQLDAGLRAEMRDLVRTLYAEYRFTAVFVTHDQTEAVEVADTIALVDDGALEAHGSPELFYRRPPSLRAARFFGAVNEIPGTVAAGCFLSACGQFRAPAAVRDGSAVLVVRPESICVTTHRNAATTATIVAARFAGPHLAAELRLRDGTAVSAHLAPDATVAVGATVGLVLPPGAGTVFSVADESGLVA